MANSEKLLTYSQLIVRDLDKAYFLPHSRSSYCKDSKIYNDKKYMHFDYPLKDSKEEGILRPIRHLATIGNAIPTLIDAKPDSLQSNHWKQWLPGFPAAEVKSVEEGFADSIPVVTTGPLQSLPVKKHAINPELHEELLCKSTIPRIGVPTPRIMNEEDVSYPCMVKVDQSSGGCGNWLVHDSQELKEVVTTIRNKCNWKGKYILQEFIPGAETMGYYFYVFKSGDIHWLGSLTGAISKNFKWAAGVGNWNKQDELRKPVYEEFILPIKNFLHNSGYFGIVNIEILVDKEGRRYLVDLNCRLPGVLAQLFIAPYMATLGYPMSLMTTSKVLTCTRKELFAMTEEINDQGRIGKVIVLAAADVDGKFKADLAVFAETIAGIHVLIDTLERKNNY